MARYDLYLLDSEKPFLINFFKGAAGIWFWTELVVAIALACSTYLSGVVAWISVIFLFIVGMFRDFALTVAMGTNVGGGPTESAIRLIIRQSQAMPLESGTVTNVVTGSDQAFLWVMRRFFDVIPDVYFFDFSDRVANGFNVSATTLSLALLWLAGYLLLWVVLAYYLIKSREIAIPS
jgi:hypothetical protein